MAHVHDDEKRRELAHFRRRFEAILAQHAEPAKPEHVQEIAIAWNKDVDKREMLTELLHAGRSVQHPWLVRNAELVAAWVTMAAPVE